MVTIATIKETKNNENRVGLTPKSVEQLKQAGHTVLVEKNAGVGAGFSDEEYTNAGASIVNTPEEVCEKTDVLVKIKEPIPEEYPLLEKLNGKILYTYLHLAGVDPVLTDKLLEHNVSAVAYETVEDERGLLPLLAPMSEIAGVLSIQYSSEYLQKKYGGRAITLGKISHVPSAQVVVIGGGIAGQKAALTGAGMGSEVTIFEISDERIETMKTEFSNYLGDNLYKNITIAKSTNDAVAEAVKDADVLIGAVLLPGAKAPKVVSEEMVKSMKKGSVIIDIAIDQGGCIWGSEPTSHSDPIKVKHEVMYCCIPNMPGQVAMQSTLALTQLTVPYLLKIADNSLESALKEDNGFLKGLNTYKGKLTCKPVADALGLTDKYQDPSELL